MTLTDGGGLCAGSQAVDMDVALLEGDEAGCDAGDDEDGLRLATLLAAKGRLQRLDNKISPDQVRNYPTTRFPPPIGFT